MLIGEVQDVYVPHQTDHVYWCHLSQNCLGPDSRIADGYECNETRKCYQAL